MAKYITPIQPLILETAGAKPTVPNPATIMPNDDRFNNQSDIMIGQFAYNLPDDTWYYRGYSGIRNLLTPTEVNVDQVEVWRSDKIYIAGNTYVSYINSSSSNTMFHTEAIYRARETTTVDESPEDSLYDIDTNPTGKWVYQGTSVTSDPTTIEETIYVEDVQLYEDDREGGYVAGEFVSYRNQSSPTEQFQTFAIYLAQNDIPEGIDPEEDTTSWKWQGTETVEQLTFPNVRLSPRNSIRLISNHKDGDIVFNTELGEIFQYSETQISSSGDFLCIKPDDKDWSESGRWVFKTGFDPSVKNRDLTIEDSSTTIINWKEYVNASVDVVTDINIEISTTQSILISSGSRNLLKSYLYISNTSGSDLSININSSQAFGYGSRANIKWANSTGLFIIKANTSYIITFIRHEVDSFIVEYDILDVEETQTASSLWEPETIEAATAEHPRWDDSLDANIYGTDRLGFNLLPAGVRATSYDGIGTLGHLWSKTESSDTTQGLYRKVFHNASVFSRSNTPKRIGVPVRLVRPYGPSDGDKIDSRILSGTFSDFDGNTYDGVIIGDQVWSTTNLKTTSYADGTAITTGYNDTDWGDLTTGAYAVYDYTLVTGIDSEAEMIAAYGLLYNWYAVDNVLGLSNDGSVPTDAEFTQLTDYIIATYPEIDSTNIGDALKSIRQVNSPFIAESDKYIKPKADELTGEQKYIKAEWIEDVVKKNVTETSSNFIVSFDKNKTIDVVQSSDILFTLSPSNNNADTEIIYRIAGNGINNIDISSDFLKSGEFDNASVNHIFMYYSTIGDAYAIVKQFSVVIEGNYAPVASSVSILNDVFQPGAVIDLDYVYNDIENDLEDVSSLGTSYKLKSYVSQIDAENDVNSIILLQGATLGQVQQYTIQEEDAGKYLVYEVTPKAQTGTIKGITSKSSPQEIQEVFDITSLDSTKLMAYYTNPDDSNNIILDNSSPASVEEWVDLSGNNINFVNTTKSEQPVVNIDSLQFDGVDDLLSRSFITTNNLIYFIIVELLENSALDRIIDANGTNQHMIQQSRIYSYVNANDISWPGYSDSLNKKKLIYNKVAGINSFSRDELGNENTGDLGSVNISTLTLAARSSRSNFSNMKVYDIVILNSDQVTQQDIDNVYNSLILKHFQ